MHAERLLFPRRLPMTWSRYFLNDYFTAREFDEVDKRIRTQARARAAGNREMRERIEELEERIRGR